MNYNGSVNTEVNLKCKKMWVTPQPSEKTGLNTIYRSFYEKAFCDHSSANQLSNRIVIGEKQRPIPSKLFNADGIWSSQFQTLSVNRNLFPNISNNGNGAGQIPKTEPMRRQIVGKSFGRGPHMDQFLLGAVSNDSSRRQSYGPGRLMRNDNVKYLCPNAAQQIALCHFQNISVSLKKSNDDYSPNSTKSDISIERKLSTQAESKRASKEEVITEKIKMSEIISVDPELIKQMKLNKLKNFSKNIFRLYNAHIQLSAGRMPQPSEAFSSFNQKNHYYSKPTTYYKKNILLSHQDGSKCKMESFLNPRLFSYSHSLQDNKQEMGPERKPEILLLVHIRLSTGIFKLEVTKNDNESVYNLVKDFCEKQELSEKLIHPICVSILSASEAINTALTNQVERKYINCLINLSKKNIHKNEDVKSYQENKTWEEILEDEEKNLLEDSCQYLNNTV